MKLITDIVYTKQDYTANPLPYAEYDNCTFTDCLFNDANLTGIIFTQCRFEGCNLSNANSKGTAFKEVLFINCKMLGLNFSVSEPFLMTLGFSECQLDLASFYRLKLKGTRFIKCSLREADFTEADFTSASFDGCDLAHVIFDNTLLEKADFRSAINYSIDPEANRIKKAKFSLQGVPGLLNKYNIDIE